MSVKIVVGDMRFNRQPATVSPSVSSAAGTRLVRASSAGGSTGSERTDGLDGCRDAAFLAGDNLSGILDPAEDEVWTFCCVGISYKGRNHGKCFRFNGL
jgi:hypothetical protein